MNILVDKYGNPFVDESIIPKIYTHDLPVVGNAKEVCKCIDCKQLRKRRDSIFKNKWYYKLDLK